MTADAHAWRLDGRLHEIPVDPGAFAAEAERLTDAIRATHSQPRELLAALGKAASVLRIAGRLEEAQRAASAAVAIADLLGDRRAAFENQLRLAHAMQWQGQFTLSTPLLDLLVAQARSMGEFRDLLDTALHHAGLDLFDQNRHGEAARCFREALALREARGEADLAQASAAALAVVTDGETTAFVEKRGLRQGA
ncbi:MAG: tetratricopeptide repeat protein [Betaproteobacteria bacterium]|nr:tetratricopeptide repeat protein [Betaproteobacteria bacterium]